MSHSRTHTALQDNRRSFLLGAAGTLAAGLASPLARPWISEADAAPLLPPRPIPGGLDLPPLIHVFVPGPKTITLPFSGLTLQGLGVEASTITDFNGVTALAYLVGTTSGNDGSSYNLEADVRVFEGEYVGADGRPRAGTFAFM